MATMTREFPSFETFESELGPELERIHELLRPSFLFRAFELAKQKQKLEQLGKQFKTQALRIRTSIPRHKKILTQIRKAIRAISLAQRIASEEDPELLKNLDVIAAQHLLIGAEADLTWVINEMFPGWIHPELRKRGERRTQLNLPMHSKETFPGHTKIDNWLIGELDKCLDLDRPAKKPARRIGRD